MEKSRFTPHQMLNCCSFMGSGGRYPQGAFVEPTAVCRLFLNRIKQYLFYVPVHVIRVKKQQLLELRMYCNHHKFLLSYRILIAIPI